MVAVNDNKVKLSDLMLVDFKSSYLTPEIEAWKEASSVIAAESCASQVWFGRHRDFEAFPVSSAQIKFMQGADAYAMLLKVVTGLTSPRRLLESNSRKQFSDGVRLFRAKHPELAKSYQTLLRQIDIDAKYINEKIIYHRKNSNLEHTAIELSEMDKGDKVLIVGHLGSAGTMSPVTANIVKACESRGRPHRDFLTITHPDPDALECIKKDIALLQRDKVVRLDVQYVPFSELSRCVEKVDRIYVALPMAHAPETDQEIVDVWQGRVNKANKMVSLLGAPNNQGQAVGPWKGLSDHDYVLSDELKSEVYKRNGDNKLLIQQANKAFKICAKLRAEDKSPKRDMGEQQKVALGIS